MFIRETKIDSVVFQKERWGRGQVWKVEVSLAFRCLGLVSHLQRWIGIYMSLNLICVHCKWRECTRAHCSAGRLKVGYWDDKVDSVVLGASLKCPSLLSLLPLTLYAPSSLSWWLSLFSTLRLHRQALLLIIWLHSYVTHLSEYQGRHSPEDISHICWCWTSRVDHALITVSGLL